MNNLKVIISGGFSLAYHALLPIFEWTTGIAVSTLSGASQGDGPKTIKCQLEQQVEVDVVILSKEGLDELVELNRIMPGWAAELATVSVQ
jgi:molybdate transport system substrate-binding protein